MPRSLADVMASGNRLLGWAGPAADMLQWVAAAQVHLWRRQAVASRVGFQPRSGCVVPRGLVDAADQTCAAVERVMPPVLSQASSEAEVHSIIDTLDR